MTAGIVSSRISVVVLDRPVHAGVGDLVEPAPKLVDSAVQAGAKSVSPDDNGLGVVDQHRECDERIATAPHARAWKFTRLSPFRLVPTSIRH